ncbi:MAG: hypothetical protein PWP24_1088 [Clostridiales bacterium]|nr:hypothetical protein [Clostridiales bacterium]
MRNVSFIIKKVLMFTFALALVSLLPLQNNFLSNNTVVAQASGTKSDTASSGARLTYETMRLVVGNERILSVRNLDRDAGEYAVFKSSDTEKVEVVQAADSKATIVAKDVASKDDDVYITVLIKDAKKRTIKTLTCNVVVGPPAQSVKFTEPELIISLSDDSSITLKASIKPGNSEEKPKIAVSKDGIIDVSNEASIASGVATISVKGLELGTVTLTISIDNGLTDTCTIQVVE